jgi:hypothetical protein
MLGLHVCSAQQLTPRVVASAGGYAKNSSVGSLSYTIGEMAMVKTFSANGTVLTQGFQQPQDSAIALSLITPAADNGSMVVYPNPAGNVAWLGYQFTAAGKAELVVTDIQGREIPYLFADQVSAATKQVHRFDCAALPAGMYVLTLHYRNAETGAVQQLTAKLQVTH